MENSSGPNSRERKGPVATLRELEERFTCYICLGIMARPYGTRCPPYGAEQRRHSFCATCIIEWFFRQSSLSGFVAQCPICSRLLIEASQDESPFTPDEAADKKIHDMIESISKEADSCDASVSGSLAEWRKDGCERQGWCRRKEGAGYRQMTFLTKVWPNMDSDHYVAIMKGLGLTLDSSDYQMAR